MPDRSRGFAIAHGYLYIPSRAWIREHSEAPVVMTGTRTSSPNAPRHRSSWIRCSLFLVAAAGFTVSSFSGGSRTRELVIRVALARRAATRRLVVDPHSGCRAVPPRTLPPGVSRGESQLVGGRPTDPVTLKRSACGFTWRSSPLATADVPRASIQELSRLIASIVPRSLRER